nr:surface glycoprotein [Haloferax sp. ATB1]
MTRNKQIRAVLLAALMVFSVFAGSIAFTGSAAAADGDFRYRGGAVHYVDGGNAVIEVPFSHNVDSASLTTDNFTVADDGDELASSAYSVSQTTNGTVVISVNNVIRSNDITVELSDDITSAEDGSTLTNDGEKDVFFAAQTFSESATTESAYVGEKLAINASSSGVNTDVVVEGTEDATDDYFVQRSTGENSTVYVLDTSGLETGTYDITVGSSTTINLTVRSLNFAVDIDDLNVTTDDDVSGTVSARDSSRPVRVELVDSSDDTYATQNVSLDGQGEADFDFDVAETDADDYTVVATDLNTGITLESDTITVEKAGDGRADFSESVITDQRGDVVAIPVTLENTDTATVTIGSDDEGYSANVTVEDGNDDGEVVVLWNSYESNDTSVSQVFDVEDDDDEILTGSDGATGVGLATSNLIDAGDYDLSVEPGASVGDGQNVATLVLEEGGVSAVRTWTAPSGETLGDLDDVTEALENGNITEDSQIAFGDQVIVQIEASGLEGAVGAQDDETPNFFATGNGYDDSYRLTINQTNPDPNRDPKIINVANASVIADRR